MGNPQNVLIGAPDRTVGYCLSGPITAALPTSTKAPTTGLTDNGYLTEDGLTITNSRTIETIKDWNLEDVRAMLTEQASTIKFAFLEVNINTLREYFGEENVDDTGDEIVIRINASTIKPRAWVWNLKDGDEKIRIVVPTATISNQEDLVFVKSDAIKLGLELTPTADAAGEKVYIYKTKPTVVAPAGMMALAPTPEPAAK